MFEALLAGRINTEGLEFDVKFTDIEQLNSEALDGKPDVTKLSYAILPEVAGAYKILNSGSALGRGNGPLLVSRGDVDDIGAAPRVAIPGLHTTANMLMSRLFPKLINKTPVLFSEIAERVAAGDFDAGVLIHEGRFTYREQGLQLVADLGERWEAATGLPLPLGAIAASRGLAPEVARRIDRVLGRSIEYAMANLSVSYDFVRKHAREMDEAVIRSHIALFVNDFSLELGAEGRRAVCELTGIGESDIFVQ